ncbi:uncharacterized protein LOC113206728 [Frankliniella occidentalis]|uniref:Uncharacterized protein LOC113206728 n=1 Tax=Frankliniella occidentalis TaxID=133901 RepID=A0A6J1SHB8_FRAOC|nr:uncharacterized protein LOC113206728 [Frankliniella occidentalis]
MQTKRGKAPAPAATTAGDEHEELTLQRLPDVRVPDCFSTLPDVPLLKALSHLAADDLVAAGTASARLGALTGAHRSLWRGKGDVEVESAEGLRVLVQVAPPVDWLQLRVLSYEQFYATFTESFGSDAVTRLTVEGPGVELAASLVRDLAPTLRRLEVSRLDVDMLLDALRAARRLHTLAVTVASGRGAVTANRPQEDVKLPRLRSLELHCDSDLAPSTVTLATLQSLVQGHSAQLRSVSLCSPRLLPLLDACPRDLRRLTVALGPGLAALLRARMQGLRELAVDMLGGPGGGGAGHWDAARREVRTMAPYGQSELANSPA